MKLQFRIDSKNFIENNNQLTEKMRDYNITQVGAYGKREGLFFGYYANNNELVAGLSAYLSWGEFYIDLLWVHENYRHQKLGSRLLQAAQQQAILKHALYLRVNTGTFQAPDFYLKNNFEVFAKLPILVAGHENQYNYFLIKYL